MPILKLTFEALLYIENLLSSSPGSRFLLRGSQKIEAFSPSLDSMNISLTVACLSKVRLTIDSLATKSLIIVKRPNKRSNEFAVSHSARGQQDFNSICP